jgi:hypothetical protein
MFSPKKSEMSKGCPLLWLLPKMVVKVSADAVKQENFKKEEKNNIDHKRRYKVALLFR